MSSLNSDFFKFDFGCLIRQKNVTDVFKNVTDQKYVGAVGFGQGPTPAGKHALAGAPA